MLNYDLFVQAENRLLKITVRNQIVYQTFNLRVVGSGPTSHLIPYQNKNYFYFFYCLQTAIFFFL